MSDNLFSEAKGILPARSMIDWFSFTLPVSAMVVCDHLGQTAHIPNNIRDLYPHISDYVMSFPDLLPGKGRKMFDSSARSETGGFTIFWRNSLPFTLFEFGGVGCQMLRKRKSLRDIIKLYGERATRIDIAIDIETDTTPDKFVENRSTDRFQSFGIEKSEAGYTHYVGSKKSDRFARVYRYSPPHPRSHLLRVEHVIRNAEAKVVASLVGNSSLASIVSALGNTFGWSHIAWTEKRTDAPLKTAPRDTGQGATERWLLTAVIPAIRRLTENGSIDAVGLFLKMGYDIFDDARARSRGAATPSDD